MNDDNNGWKWWIRFVIVPLIGGGGLIAIFVAIIVEKPDVSESSSNLNKSICEISATANTWHKTLQSKNEEHEKEALKKVETLAGNIEVSLKNGVLRQKVRGLQPCMLSYKKGIKDDICNIRQYANNLAELGGCAN